MIKNSILILSTKLNLDGISEVMALIRDVLNFTKNSALKISCYHCTRRVVLAGACSQDSVSCSHGAASLSRESSDAPDNATPAAGPDHQVTTYLTSNNQKLPL